MIKKPGNVIANGHFASPTDLEMTSAFGPWHVKELLHRVAHAEPVIEAAAEEIHDVRQDLTRRRARLSWLSRRPETLTSTRTPFDFPLDKQLA